MRALLLFALWCAPAFGAQEQKAAPSSAEKAPPASAPEKASPPESTAAPKAAAAAEKTPAATPGEKVPADLAKDAKLAAIASALETGYGKLFEGVARDEKLGIVVRMAGQSFVYDDGKAKTPAQRIEDADVEDMFVQPYPLANPTEKVEKDDDPGRARVEDFFKALYGGTEGQVRANLTTVNFCGTKVRFNSRCGAADALTAVGKDLDGLFEKKPEWKEYVRELGGTFQWRLIAGTQRLSNHSFGTAIDLNVKKSAYWRWAPASTLANFSRKDWPTELIEIFERHGFIWGGKWWHYDTMHFEFRPELIAHAKANPAKAGPAEKAGKPAEPPGKVKPKASDLLIPLHGREGKSL
jgi:hypothetical protein